MSSPSRSFTRREFVKTTIAGSVATALGRGPSLQSTNTEAQPSAISFRLEKEDLRLSNGIVELVIDRHNGYFRNIRNLAAGTEHKPPVDGVWPFGFWLGSPKQPKQRVAEITAHSTHPVRHRFNRPSDDVGILELVYPSLLENATGRSTGVGLQVRIRFCLNWDYFTVRATCRNGAPLSLTNFYAGRGTQLTGDSSRTEEQFTSCLFGSTPRTNLKAFSKRHPIYSYPWYDYQGQRASIGTAYINRQGMMMMFDVAPEKNGVQQSWRTFNLEGYGLFESALPPRQQHHIYGLEAGAQFSTDEWVIAPHQGDWHRMADIYRERYNEVFGDDYANYSRASQSAKNVHLWAITCQPDEFAEKVERTLTQLSLHPQRLGVLIQGGGTTSDQPKTPDWLSCSDDCPRSTDASGADTLTNAITRIKKVGIRHVMACAHPINDDREDSNHVTESQSKWRNSDLNPPADTRMCEGNSSRLRLWHDNIAVQVHEAGANSLYLDMEPLIWAFCQERGSTDTHIAGEMGILTASVRDVLSISKTVRTALGPDGSTMIEASDDIAGRWVDIWSAFAEPTLKYTWPDKLYFGMPCTVKGLNDALIYGHVPYVNLIAKCGLTESLSVPGLNSEVLVSLRRFLDLRERLAQAPGYPHGFRDDVGLSVSDPNLIAKAFQTSGKGLTVVYYAKVALQGSITVDAGMLENSWVGPAHREEISLDKDEAVVFVL